MNEEEVKKSLEELNRKVDEIYFSVEKTRKYFLTTLIISVVLFILPLILLGFAIPSFLSTYSSAGIF
jgi:hypothetical protein